MQHPNPMVPQVSSPMKFPKFPNAVNTAKQLAVVPPLPAYDCVAGAQLNP